MPQSVKIVEVGPRDGLQNEKQTVSVATKIELVERLAAAGLKSVEAGAFVSPKWAPQMAASDEVMAGVKRCGGVTYPVLTPSLKGYEAAWAAKADMVAAPMPGVITLLKAKPGEKVEAGATLLIMEAMKMERAIKAPHDDVVKSFNFKPGDQVKGGALLVEFDEM